MTHARKINYDRRRVLKAGFAGVSAPFLAGFLSQDGSTETAGGMKNVQLSLAAYSMRQELTNGKMDLFEFIDWCAELGLTGTELTSYYFEENFDRTYLHRLRRHAFRRGLSVSGTAVRNNFCLPPGEKKQREIEHVRRWIGHAADLFAPHIRIFAGNVPSGTEKSTAIQWVAEGIQQVLEEAERHGVFIGLENHGGITAEAADHLAICDAVGDHPWFGINLDTGNYRKSPYEELAMAAPRAVNVQVKVEIWSPEGEKVPADLRRIRSILKESGYRGWIALEYEAEGDPRKEIPHYVERMKDLFLRS